MAFPALPSRTVKHSDQRQLCHLVVPFPIKETWTHYFSCVTDKKQERTAAQHQSDLLIRAGLGRTKIIFKNKNASHSEVCAKLEETFPQLKIAGGYTLHRSMSGGRIDL